MTTTKEGIILPSKEEKVRVDAIVEALGDKVDANGLFKIGDKVMANDYDFKYVDNADSEHEPGYQMYVLTKASSIMAVLK